MPPKNPIEKKTFPLWSFLILFGTLVLLALAVFYGANLFLLVSWLASLGSSRNVGVVLFRIGLVPVFALIFAGLAVVHSWLGSSRERHNKGFLIFKFFFFFVAVCVAESFLRISENIIYAVMAGSTGIKDSLFFIDMSWYLFWLPLVKNISFFLTCYFILLFIFRISYPGDHKKIAYGKSSLCLFSLFSIIFLLVAYGQYLSDRRTLGSDPFLGYSDIFGHILPLAASLIWTWGFLALSIYFLRRRYKTLFAGGVLTFIVLLGCNVIWPFYLDKFVIAPNRIFYQNKYAGIHAKNTLKAFGLENLAKDSSLLPDAENAASGLSSAFILDKDILLKQIQNTQTFSGALSFLNISPLTLNGRAYYIAPRTLSGLSTEWELLHFRNIHGYGAVIASASRTDINGGPAYSLKGLEMEGEFELDNPEIFFDESFDSFAFINTKMPIPNYKQNENPLIEKTFTGVESIRLGFLHKLALAVSQRDMRPLLTKYYTPDTKLIYFRKPSELAKKILPYFDYSSPKPIYFNRALWWEMDGYVSSENVFVAASVETPWGIKNWLRAPIRVYVNAYSGEVFFHRVNENDPMVKVISKVFPKLFTKQVNPESLSYPDTLFAVQSKLLERYHETNESAFYADINTRSLSGDKESVLLPLADKKTIGFSQNYSPLEKKGFSARFTAYVNAKGRSSLHLYEASSPALDNSQAANVLKASVEYQNMVSYWRGLEIVPQIGVLSSFPYKEGVFYVQPIYTNSASIGMPILAKAALIQGSQVFLADTLGELPSMLGLASQSVIPLTREQLLDRTLREAYLFYLEAEKSRVQGKAQDYQKNVDKLGEKLRQAAN